MTCQCCVEKDRLIAELEEALEGAIYLEDTIAVQLSAALGISHQQAQVVQLLAKAGNGFLSGIQLEGALPAHPQGDSKRKDRDFRAQRYPSVIVYGIRRKLGQDFVENKHHSGYRLAPHARKRVEKILEET